MDADPRSRVEAPVRTALATMVGRGLVVVVGMTLVALWPIVVSSEAVARDAIAVAAVGVLLAYAIVVRLTRRLSGHPDDEALERAWVRAREIDGDDATLGLLVVGWVPVGLLLGMGVLIWSHLTDPNPALAAAWAVFGLPAFVIAWIAATRTWLDACRGDLARAESESDNRLRHYWANVSH